MSRFLLLALALGLSTPELFAQSYAELRGRVVDEQDAVMPGVNLAVRNQDSGQVRETVSNADGSYFMTALLPGLYEISAELAGFKRYSRGEVRLEVGRTTTVEIRLELGGIEESVTVMAASPLVDITSKEVGGNIGSLEIIETPTVNRNFTGYMQLLPGVVAAQLTSWGADSVTINGQPFRNTDYRLDGGYNNDMWNGGAGGAQARTPIESVAEFQIQTSQYDAEFGTTSGGVVNAISKQGTNRLQGSAFGFFKGSALTAEEFFTKQFDLEKPDNSERQWGGAIGGPIVADKAHFFASVERVTQDRPVTINIPSRPEFNKNVVWKDRIWNALVRFDHQINSNHTWALRWLSEWSPQTDQLTNTRRTEATREQENDVDYTWSGSINSVLSPNTVNTIRFHATVEDVTFGNPGYFETGSQAALPARLQQLTFQDQQSSRHSRRRDSIYGLDETFSWFLAGKNGDHDIKFGAQYLYAPLLFQAEDLMNGQFNFNTDLSFDPNNPRTYPERLQIRVPGAIDYELPGHFIGFFAQDAWRVSSRLTLNLGLRYDVEIIKVDESNNPSFAAGDHPLDTNNIAPRVGATYALDEDGRSVVRGGFGIFYQKTPYTFLGNFISNGVIADSFLVLFPTNGIDPGPSQGRFPTDPMLVNGPVVNRDLLDQLYPPGTTVKNRGDVFLDHPDRKVPFSRQITIGYQRELSSDMSVSVDYVHSENRDQVLRRNLNPPMRTSTARTGRLVRPNPEFVQNVWEPANVGRYDYDALQLMLMKRFGQGYSFRASYTLSSTRGNTPQGDNEIIATQLGDDLQLDDWDGPGNNDRPHILSVAGTLEVPGAPDLTVSPVVRYMSGTPFTLINSSFDMDQNGRFDNEFLPPGTYSGVGDNAITVDNEGGRNGARGPDFFELSLRVAYGIRMGNTQRLQFFGEIFNLTNRANFVNPADGNGLADQRLSDFLVLRALQRGATSRIAQLGIRFEF